MTEIVEQLVAEEEESGKRKGEKKGMFSGGTVFLCILALLLLFLLVKVVVWPRINKKQNNADDAHSRIKRKFTEDDRQAVLLIQELGDIIATVEKKM